MDETRQPRQNAAEIAFKTSAGTLSDEPRTVRLLFPGEDRHEAMGFAGVMRDSVVDCGISAEVEYVGLRPDRDSVHRVNLHIEGGDGTGWPSEQS